MPSAAFTTMSQNGQVVIPQEIRRELKLKPKTRFLVLESHGKLLLKPVDEREFRKDFELLGRLAEIEEEVRKGKYTSLPSDMSAEEMYKALLGRPWKPSSATGSRRNSKK